MSQKARPKRTRFKLLVAFMAVLLVFAVGEIGVRTQIDTDEDGNQYFGLRQLKPFHLPVSSTAAKVAEWQNNPSHVRFDQILGWRPKAGSSSKDGLYHYNRDAIRAGHVEWKPNTSRDIFKIAIYGDSFVHGDEVAFEDTWGYQLEKNLNEAGIPAEVWNFGVSGYGMDQAFLRWQSLKTNFIPDLILMGFHQRDIKRNLNIIRPVFYPKAGIPFAKPRFVLQNDGLRAVNVPVPNPNDLPKILSDFEAWPNHIHEYFYHPEDYEQHLWQQSKLIALTVDVLGQNRYNYTYTDEAFYDFEHEPAQLAKRIMGEFRKGVEAQYQNLYVVHLPDLNALHYYQANGRFPYHDLLMSCEYDDLGYVETLEKQPDASKAVMARWFINGGHYSREGNELVAKQVAFWIHAYREAHEL